VSGHESDVAVALGPTLTELRLADVREGDLCPNCELAVCTADRWCPSCSIPWEPIR
jgi:hypothetical protein